MARPKTLSSAAASDGAASLEFTSGADLAQRRVAAFAMIGFPATSSKPCRRRSTLQRCGGYRLRPQPSCRRAMGPHSRAGRHRREMLRPRYRLFPSGRDAVLPHHETPMEAVLRTGTPARNREVVIERPDSSRITVLVNIAPCSGDDGALVGAVNCFQDISAAKAAERERVAARGGTASSQEIGGDRPTYRRDRTRLQ